MHIFRDLSAPLPFKGCVLAIGNFDGMHLGHRAVLEQALAVARGKGKPCIAMTFTPHPRQYFSPQTAPGHIEPLRLRLLRMREMHLHGVMLARFNASFAAIKAESFVEKLLVETLGVTHVVVGEDFHFGHRRQGDIRFLQDQAVRHRFGCTYVLPVMKDGSPISSTRIRTALSEGNPAEAEALLGRPYEIFGRVIHGDKRGREMQVPTANLALGGLHVPRYGVYAARFGGEESSGERKWQDGVANIGVKPTFGAKSAPLLELHGFGQVGDLYGRRLRVRLVEHLRDEKSFDSTAELMRQIGRDIGQASRLLKGVEWQTGNNPGKKCSSAEVIATPPHFL